MEVGAIASMHERADLLVVLHLDCVCRLSCSSQTFDIMSFPIDGSLCLSNSVVQTRLFACLNDVLTLALVSIYQ